MSVAANIAQSYRRPGRVFERLLAAGQREDRVLAYLMAGCVLMFIAQLPRLSREAHLEGSDLNMLMGASLMALVFILPLLLYALAWLSHVVARIVGGQGSFWSARLVLFWALLAASPLLLLHGLVAGFIGPGLQLTLAGLLWFGVFLWFWGTGLWCSEWKRTTA